MRSDRRGSMVKQVRSVRGSDKLTEEEQHKAAVFARCTKKKGKHKHKTYLKSPKSNVCVDPLFEV
jgi:hypothetical protein